MRYEASVTFIPDIESFTSMNVTRCVQFCHSNVWALGHNAPEPPATETP